MKLLESSMLCQLWFELTLIDRHKSSKSQQVSWHLAPGAGTGKLTGGICILISWKLPLERKRGIKPMLKRMMNTMKSTMGPWGQRAGNPTKPRTSEERTCLLSSTVRVSWARKRVSGRGNSQTHNKREHRLQDFQKNRKNSRTPGTKRKRIRQAREIIQG